jgi:hypothetical protein
MGSLSRSVSKTEMMGATLITVSMPKPSGAPTACRHEDVGVVGAVRQGV